MYDQPKLPGVTCDLIKAILQIFVSGSRFVTRVAVGRQIQRLRNPSEACYKIRDCREGVDRVQQSKSLGALR